MGRMKIKKSAERREIAKRIAKERIERLFSLARKRVEEGELEYARKYVQLAKRIAMKAQIKIPKELKESFCKNCFLPLIPGKTCKVRKTKKRITKICLNCGRKREKIL